MKIIYYFYYHLYKDYLYDSDPSFISGMALSTSLNVIFFNIAKAMLRFFPYFSFSHWDFFIVFTSFISLTYFVLYYKVIKKTDIEKIPILFGNKLYAKVFTIVFAICTIISFFMLISV